MNGRVVKDVWVLAVGAIAMAVGACSEDSVGALETKALWSYDENPDIEVVKQGDYEYDLDFGTVALGARAVLDIQVTNAGAVSLTVLPITNVDGFAADIASPGITVNVGETRTIKVWFSPTEEKPYDSGGVLSVADNQTQNLKLTLRGVGQAAAFTCDVAKLDFGNVLKGRRKILSVSCRNQLEVEGVLIVQPITGEHAALFSHPIAPDGRLALKPGESHKIDVTYRADAYGLATASLELLREVNNDDPSRVANIRLEGFAVNHAISCGPSTLDFGYAAPDTEKHLQITCLNQASEPFEITGIALEALPDSRFSWEATVTPIVIQAYANDVPGEKKIDVAFAPIPDDLGTRKGGALVLTTNDEMTPRIEVALTGFVGGPVISCTPKSINFGQVAKGSPVTKSFTCSNDGTDDPNSTEDALVVTGFESTNPDEFSAKVRGQLNGGGYPVGGSFIVDVTYHPVDDKSDSDSIRILSNDTVHPANDPYAVAVTGFGNDLPACQYEIVPAEVRFGRVDRGDSSTLDFAVRNLRSDAECLIRDLRLAPSCPDAFSLSGDDDEIILLPAGGELRFPITFSPTVYQSTPFICEVLFDISDPDDPHQSVHVRGASQEPCILIDPSYLDFGRVKPGNGCSSRDREFRITNICSAPIVFDHLELGNGSSKEFVVRAEPTSRHSLAAGDFITFALAYQPEDEGEDRGSVLVFFADTDEPYMATLYGVGATDARQTDKFHQSDRPNVDILWVIDNSGSMADEQANLGANLEPFLRYAEAQSIDYHIGITTTGLTPSINKCPGGVWGGEDGRLFPVDGASRGQPRIITRDTKNMEQVWAENFRVGTCHGDEQVFEAALRALTPPVIDSDDDPRHDEPDDGNYGFLRSDGYLSIIAVSDEFEQSPLTVSYYYSELQKIKGARNPHLFSFHAITGDPGGGCGGGNANGGAESGERLIAMVERTNGVFQSICTADWARSLESMSAVAFGYKDCFLLGNTPEDSDGDGSFSDTNGEILVKVNGRSTASIGAHDQPVWSYDSDKNAVCFSPLSVPAAGAQLEVNYGVACGG